MASSAPIDGLFADEIATLTFEIRRVCVFVAWMPTWMTSPSFAPDWKLNAGLFGFVRAATFWLTLMYAVVPTSAVVIAPS